MNSADGDGRQQTPGDNMPLRWEKPNKEFSPLHVELNKVAFYPPGHEEERDTDLRRLARYAAKAQGPLVKKIGRLWYVIKDVHPKRESINDLEDWLKFAASTNMPELGDR
jgi:hypothetical protein